MLSTFVNIISEISRFSISKNQYLKNISHEMRFPRGSCTAGSTCPITFRDAHSCVLFFSARYPGGKMRGLVARLLPGWENRRAGSGRCGLSEFMRLQPTRQRVRHLQPGNRSMRV